MSLTSGLTAQEKPAEKKTDETTNNSNPLGAGYRLQECDDLAFPMQPVIPRSAAVEKRNEALSWYMMGRLFDANHRNEPRKALSAFQKAVKLDPEAIEIYRNLVPLEFAFDNIEAAVRYATKAAQLDPDDYEILQLLAVQAANAGLLPEAIKHLEQAVKSPRVVKLSPEFVMLNKSLGLLYHVTGQKELAADCYEIIFDAVKTPEKYDLDPRAKKALLDDPPTSYENIGQVLMDANRLKLALEAFELAAAKSPRLSAGSLNFNRAKILFLSEKYEDALAQLQKYFDAQQISKGRQPYQLLSDILAKLNRSDELIRRLETMAENDAQNAWLQYFLADKLADVEELERARTIYDTMLRKGGDASGYAGLARVLRKMQKSDDLLDALGRGFTHGDEAIAALAPEVVALSKDEALVALLIESGRARVKSNQLKFEQAYLLAKFAAAVNNADAASEFYHLAVSLNRDPRRSVDIHFEMVRALLLLRKYEQAADACKELLATKQLNDKGQSLAYYYLSQALTFDNHTDEALEAISKAIALDNDENADFRLLEARIYTHAKRWDESVRKFDQIMHDFPDRKEVILLCQFSLSNVYVQKGEMQKGEEILEKVYEVNPENPQVNNDLGYLWADQGKNLEQAEKMIRKALAAEPDNGAYLDSLGWVLFKLERYEEAIPPLEQATKKLLGGDATGWDHLGDAQLKAKHVEKAIEAWQTALKHSEEDSSSVDVQLVERIKDKLKQHGAETQPKPAEKGSP